MARNQSIDLIKIIAMIMVVRMHIGINPNLAQFAPWGFIHGLLSPAIPLFFMVSGYLMQCKTPDYKYVMRKIGGILRYVYIIVPFSCLLTGLVEHHPRIHSLYLWFFFSGNMWHFWFFGAMILLYLLSPYVCRLMAGTKDNLALGIMALICTIVVILNVYYQFEQRYVLITFRLWTWLFFFMLGAHIKQYGSNQYINWLWVIVLMGNAAIFINAKLTPLFDYVYGSFICAAYAYGIFCACLNSKIKNSKFITELSTLFLPVYTIHPFVIQLYGKYIDFNMYQQWSGTICFVIVLFFTIAISYILVKTPYVKNIFKICQNS